MLQYLGSLSPGECIPMAALAQGKLSATVNLALPELEAKVEGILAAQASLTLSPPSLSASLDAALALVAQLEASIALGMPSASIDLNVVIGLLAELQLSLGALQAELQWSLAFGILLGAPGVHLFVHSGAVRDVLPGGIPGGAGPAQEAFGVMLLATDSGAISALRALFRTE